MAYWILKTEPNRYSFSDLQRDGATVWDGVTNAQALIHIRAMRPDDQAIIYHTGDERAAVGLAQITSEPYPDPASPNPKHTVVTLAPLKPLTSPVSLSQIKQEPAFADSALVRHGRLSVAPCTAEHWQLFLTLSNTEL